MKLQLEIQKKIESLETLRDLINLKARKKAETLAQYDKDIAITIVKLRNGLEVNFEGEVIKNPPNALIEKIARGICWESKMYATYAEAEYKGLITQIDGIKAELNGLQSINKYYAEL